MDGFSYLLKVGVNGYHILPNESTSQEINMNPFRRANRLKIEQIPQLDGSRFKIITSVTLSDSSLLEKLKIQAPGIRGLLMETELTPSELRKLIQSRYDELKFIFYHTHLFFGGHRYVPIISHHSAQTFYDASGLYPEYIDSSPGGFGVIVESVEDLLSSPHIDTFEVVEYLPRKRLCPSCGRVYDSEKPINHPDWRSGR